MGLLKMENVFKLNNVCLYAKMWYQHTNDLYGDLSLMLKMDGYPLAFRHLDIFNTILYRWEQWNMRREHPTLLSQLMEGIKDETNTDIHEIILRQILSSLLFVDGKELGLKKPIYKKGLPKIGRYKFGMTYKQMNHFADKIFNKNSIF